MPGKRTIAVSDGTGQGAEVARAAEALARGGLVAFPTETVFALAASAESPHALRRLAALKRWPAGRPFALLIADLEDVERFDCVVTPAARRLMESFWPGAMTLVLPQRQGGTVGLRLPDHVLARAIVRAAPCRVAATSANRSGQPPRFTAQEIAAEFGDQLEWVIEDRSVPSSLASTVIQMCEAGWRVLRQGEITQAQIRTAIESA